MKTLKRTPNIDNSIDLSRVIQYLDVQGRSKKSVKVVDKKKPLPDVAEKIVVPDLEETENNTKTVDANIIEVNSPKIEFPEYNKVTNKNQNEDIKWL